MTVATRMFHAGLFTPPPSSPPRTRSAGAITVRGAGTHRASEREQPAAAHAYQPGTISEASEIFPLSIMPPASPCPSITCRPGTYWYCARARERERPRWVVASEIQLPPPIDHLGYTSPFPTGHRRARSLLRLTRVLRAGDHPETRAAELALSVITGARQPQPGSSNVHACSTPQNILFC